MKKFFLVFSLAGAMVACNNASESANDAQDSLDSIASERKEAIDSSAEARKDAIDSTTEEKKEVLEKRDSADRADTSENK